MRSFPFMKGEITEEPFGISRDFQNSLSEWVSLDRHCREENQRSEVMSELPEIKTRRKGRTGTQQMLIPSEQMVAEELNAAAAGQHLDVSVLRQRLAAKHGADACCPATVQKLLVTMSCGDTAPFWRVVDPDRPFARRLAGGPDRIRAKLAEERNGGRRE
jgi:hypothetical protein